MSRNRHDGRVWKSRKKVARTRAKNRRVGRTAGDFAYQANGREIWLPDRIIKHVKEPTRYCLLPMRGHITRAVIDTRTKRAVGSAYADELALRTCSDTLSGARKRRAR